MASLKELDSRVTKVEDEIARLRDFRHATNGELQKHNGLFERLEVEQERLLSSFKATADTFTKALEKLSGSLEGASGRIDKLMNLKFLVVGGFVTASFLVTAVIFMLNLYFTYFKK